MPRKLSFQLTVAACLAVASVQVLAQTPTAESTLFSPRATVGARDDGSAVLPQSQILMPAGRQISLPGMRPQALALSPDGRWLVTSGQTHELLVLDAASGNVLQRVPLPGEQSAPGPVSDHILEPDSKGQLSYTGLIFSPDGKRIFLSNVNGSIKVFAVENNNVRALASFALPEAKAPRRKEEIPAGLALSADATRLYVAGNLSNSLLELDATSGRVLRTIAVGVAPYDVVVKGEVALVSNWGGRVPDEQSPVGPAGRGTLVRVDGTRFIASEGSVSLIDLKSGKETQQVLAGRHASALALSPDGKFVVVANAADDTLSVLNARSGDLVETIGLRVPGQLFGAVPDALCFFAFGPNAVGVSGRTQRHRRHRFCARKNGC